MVTSLVALGICIRLILGTSPLYVMEDHYKGRNPALRMPISFIGLFSSYLDIDTPDDNLKYVVVAGFVPTTHWRGVAILALYALLHKYRWGKVFML